MKASILASASLWLFVIPSSFAAFPEGGYLRKNHTGGFTLKSSSETSFDFDLSATNSQGNACEITGKAQVSGQKAEFKEEKCNLSFSLGKDVVKVTAKACDSFCGLNATVDGEYRLPGEACAEKKIADDKATFKKLYDEKKYKEGMELLKPILEKCEFFLDGFEKGWLLSDLAISAAHEGDSKGCLAYVKKAKASVPDGGPTIEEEVKKLTTALKTNEKACKKPKK